MSRESLLVLVGILVALSPFSGLPLVWLAFITPFLGAVTVLIGFSLASRKRNTQSPVYEAPANNNA